MLVKRITNAFQVPNELGRRTDKTDGSIIQLKSLQKVNSCEQTVLMVIIDKYKSISISPIHWDVYEMIVSAIPTTKASDRSLKDGKVNLLVEGT